MALELAALEHTDRHWTALKQLVLDSVSSPESKRAYSFALDQFRSWYLADTRAPFSKPVVLEYKAALERVGFAPSTIALRISAVRKLALEAVDVGLLDPQVGSAVQRVRAPRRKGRRLGNWLTCEQTSILLRAPDITTLRGKRDRAILAVASGCGLRRKELASLTCKHLQLRDGAWLILDLIGKQKRIRTVPVPLWVKPIVDQWTRAARISSGSLFRPINKSGALSGVCLSPQAIYGILKTCGYRAGLNVAPHDLRRTFARTAHQGGAPIEQIQYALGHASITTTERYLGLAQDLKHAPGDYIRLAS